MHSIVATWSTRLVATCPTARTSRSLPRTAPGLEGGPRDRQEAGARALTDATLVVDGEETVVLLGPKAEVTLRAAGGGSALDVDCDDEELAERVRTVLEPAICSHVEDPA